MIDKTILFFMPSIEGGGVEKNLFIVSNYFAKKFKSDTISLISPLNNKEQIEKNWPFLTPGSYEKMSTILHIMSGIIISKNLSDNRENNFFTLSLCANQKYFAEHATHDMICLIPIVKINVKININKTVTYTIPETINKTVTYTIPEIILTQQKIIYYKSYLENIKINIRNRMSSFQHGTSPLIKSKEIHLLSRFFCAYYSFLQENTNLAESLYILHNEKDVVDVCELVSKNENFAKENLERFYTILEKSTPTYKKTKKSVKLNTVSDQMVLTEPEILPMTTRSKLRKI